MKTCITANEGELTMFARTRTTAGISTNDTRDPERPELMLIRAGHHLWVLKRLKTVSVKEREAIDEALETIWEAKRQYRAELQAKLKAQGAEFSARMRKREAL